MVVNILTILIMFRFIAAMYFLETEFHKKDIFRFLLPAGWLIYAIGPVFAIVQYIHLKNLNHPLFGFSTATGTFFIILSLIRSFISPSVKIITTLFICMCTILISGFTIFPSYGLFLTLSGQLLIILTTFFIILLNRKWIIEVGGLSSYLWLILFFCFSLFAIYIHIIFTIDPLAVRFTLTLFANLILFITFLHFDREQTIGELKWSRQQIAESLNEKEILLREIHHRVKNNMAIMNSLLNLQSAEFEDPCMIEQFKKAQNRIEAMAMVHQKLHESQMLSKVPFREYVSGLIEHVSQSFDEFIEINTDIEDFDSSPEMLIPCGLIINEAIMNSMKHAFYPDDDKKISIKTVLSESKFLHLTIADNGKGFPDNFSPEKISGLGFQLIISLAKQLEAEIELKNVHGSQILLKIPFHVH